MVFTIHIIHWKLTGRTLAPLELNEVMYTLELGIITAGFLFMCFLVLGTLIFGRFFCSWACHIMVLQDLCAWLLRKFGIRQKPVRSRLLLFVPPLTAFYMFRSLFMTFFGQSRVDEHVAHHIHESPKIMTVPLMVLAVLSIIGGYIGVPHILGGANHIHEFLAPVLGGGAEPAKAHAGISILSQAWASGGEGGGHGAALELLMMVVSVAIALIGIGIAYLFYVKNPALPKMLAERWKGLYTLVFNKYYVDEIYEILFINSLKHLGTGLWKGFDDLVIDGSINGVAYLIGMLSGAMRKIQTGLVQNYAFSMIIGGVVLVAYYIVRAIFY